jgi:hypothetical protein
MRAWLLACALLVACREGSTGLQIVGRPVATPLFDGKRLRLQGRPGETVGLRLLHADGEARLSLPPQIATVSGGGNDWEAAILDAAPPGRYRGQITVGERAFTVELTVEPRAR